MTGSVLVVGFGNPAREDDGLGPAAAEMVEKAGIPNVSVDIDYQLSVEHASDIAKCETVVFVDASVDADEPFVFKRISGKATESFSSHSVSPEQVLGLAENLFQAGPKGYILGIRGYSFEMFVEQMTDRARDNLRIAANRLITALENGNFEEKMGEMS